MKNKMKFQKANFSFFGHEVYKVKTGEFYKGKEKVAMLFSKESLNDFLRNPEIISNEQLEDCVNRQNK